MIGCCSVFAEIEFTLTTSHFDVIIRGSLSIDFVNCKYHLLINQFVCLDSLCLLPSTVV